MSHRPGETRRHPEIRSEKTDADASAIVRFLVYLVLGTVAVVVLLRWLFVTLIVVEERQQPPPPVMKAEVPPQPPLPRLEIDPPADLARYREEQHKGLDSYGWVDRPAGVVHIPIDEAMRIVAEHGLPTRGVEETKAPAASQPGGKKK
jgi:hypothetical protein